MAKIDDDERFEISYPAFLVGYFVILIFIVTLSLALDRFMGVDWHRAVFVSCGLLFVAAALGWPRHLYLIVRNTGWFASIRSPLAMRWLLALLGIALTLAGLLAPARQLR